MPIAVLLNLVRHAQELGLSKVIANQLPAGFSADGLPIGVQLIGNYFAEAKLLGAAVGATGPSIKSQLCKAV